MAEGDEIPRPARRPDRVPALPGLRRRRRTAAAAPEARPARPRPSAYFVVAGVALDREMARLRALPVFADGPLAERAPELKVRRARRQPNRLGFAVPTQFRLSVTAYPGIGAGDVLETLLHELTHLHVGRAAEAHAWHGPTFRRTLSRAMAEAYGITGVRPRHSRHGVYAAAIQAAIPEYPDVCRAGA